MSPHGSAEELFERYLAGRAAGAAPDPLDLLDEAGPEREQLAGMLTAYLAARPAQDVSAAAVEARAALPASEPPASWDVLLPRLRARARKTRATVVRELAAALGFPAAQRRVEGYVHGLETGALSPRRVRPPVVAALAGVLGVAAELLEASRALPPLPPPEAAPLARRGAVVAADMAPPPADATPLDVDELDDLFTGGDA